MKPFTVDVYAICYNEAYMLPFFIEHYQRMYNAQITIIDNFSTDPTPIICKQYGVKYLRYESGNQIRDDIYLQIKNNCWKESNAEWVIVCDIDEFLEVDFDIEKYSLIAAKGYNMIGDPTSRIGVPAKEYNKFVMFRPRYITDINYNPGCHGCAPKGRVMISREIATLCHRKYISEKYLYARHKMYEKRLSDVNKKYNWGHQYKEVTMEKIEKEFEELRSKAVDVPVTGAFPNVDR